MKKIGLVLWALMASLAIASSASFGAETLAIREGYVREMPPGQSTTAAYMDLVNSGARPIAIVAATSDIAEHAELHVHRQQNGMMQMEQVARVEIPAHGHVLFAPSGYHLMLINLKRSLHAGEKINITLLDEEGKFYTAKLPVVNIVSGVPPAH